MSRFAIMKRIRPGPWIEDGEITVNAELIAAIEVQDGCGGANTKLTLTGGREVCVKGRAKDIRQALVALETGGRRQHRSLFEDVFGIGYDRPWWARS